MLGVPCAGWVWMRMRRFKRNAWAVNGDQGVAMTQQINAIARTIAYFMLTAVFLGVHVLVPNPKTSF